MLLGVRRRLLYTLSLRDLATMSLERGIAFTHEAVREWEDGDPRAGGALLLTERLRDRRRGKAGTRWFVDEAYGGRTADRAVCTVRSTGTGTWWTRC